MSPKSKVQSPKSELWTALAERSGDSALFRDQKRRRASLAAAVQMAPVATNLNDIRDIKPPVAIPSGWEWLWWTLGALAVAALLFAAWRYWQKRRSQILLEPPVPAHVRAKQKLQEALALITRPEPFCVLISDTIRTYLEERFDFRAPERTTEEFLHELQGTDLLATEQKEKLGEFLERCDLVKFAKYEPREPELCDLHGSALRLVEETEPKPNPALNTQQAQSCEPTLSKIQEPTKGKVLAITGVILQLGNSVFFFAYVIGIMRELKWYQELPAKITQEMSHESSLSLEQLISTFSQPPKWISQQQDIWDGVLIASGLGVLIGIVGLVLIVIALTKQRYQAEWFFWFLIIYSVILLGVIPFGTIAGIFFLVYCLTKRREFLKRS